MKSVLDKRSNLKPVLKEYIEKRNQNNVLFINIESVPAMDNLDEILAVNGLDGVVIGPYDLSCSLGVPEDYANPVFKKAVIGIIAKTRAQGLGVGIHLSEEPELQIEWAEKGMNIILHSSDISLFGKALNHDIAKIRQVLQENPDTNQYQDQII